MQAVVISDSNLNITWANPALCKLVSRRLDELRGTSFLKLLDEPQRGKLYDLLTEAATIGTQVRHAVTFNTGRGAKTRILFKIDIVDDGKSGKPVYRIAQGDTTELKREPKLPYADGGDDMKRAYRFSNLTLEEGQLLFESLDRKLDKEKVYLDVSFGIEEAAKFMHTNTTYISQVVNFFTDQSFPYYINYKRLHYLLDLYQRTPSDQRVELWSKAGFGSYHAFYRYVKSSMNTTPKALFKDHAALQD